MWLSATLRSPQRTSTTGCHLTRGSWTANGPRNECHAARAKKKKDLTREERRERRLLRREKQPKDNIGRAAKMHAARLQIETYEHGKSAAGLKASTYVGCSGWFYWKWRELFYPNDLPTGQWFRHYANRFHTVEINASFYSPTVANVKAWGRQAGKRSFVYTVKVCELITHIKRFRGTKTLIKDFGMIADRRPDGVLSIPASTKSSLYKGATDGDSRSARSSTAERR